MYYYLYDSFLNDNKYQKIIHRVENRITDLGITGKISRMSMLINPEKMAREEIKRGVKTIIAVGNDKTLDKIISVATEEKITVGIIPIGKNNDIAKTLGIPEGSLACDIISQRRVKKIDLMKVNDRYCLSNIAIEIKKGKIIYEDKYEINLLSKRGEIYVYNLADKNELKKIFDFKQDISKYFNPQDGLIDIIIKPNPKTSVSSFFGLIKRKKDKSSENISIIPIKKFKITEKETPSAICDNSTIVKAPLDIKVIPGAIDIIVGKQRSF